MNFVLLAALIEIADFRAADGKAQGVGDVGNRDA